MVEFSELEETVRYRVHLKDGTSFEGIYLGRVEDDPGRLSPDEATLRFQRSEEHEAKEIESIEELGN